MKIFPISDIHFEFYALYSPLRCSVFAPYTGEADIVVAAGDIHTRGRGPESLRKVYTDREIVLVSGNHEYYHSSLEEQEELVRKQCGQ